mmetsp:Transcript_23561/g.63870  ORF Transcript_23561/g.63870 Transcript_23561/m.63870 type:complete len:200 (-) Transcript_23561:291-890(-)
MPPGAVPVLASVHRSAYSKTSTLSAGARAAHASGSCACPRQCPPLSILEDIHFHHAVALAAGCGLLCLVEVGLQVSLHGLVYAFQGGCTECYLVGPILGVLAEDKGFMHDHHGEDDGDAAEGQGSGHLIEDEERPGAAEERLELVHQAHLRGEDKCCGDCRQTDGHGQIDAFDGEPAQGLGGRVEEGRLDPRPVTEHGF